MSAVVLSGLLAGYAVAVPVGAIGALIVTLASRHSWKVGAAAALGVATADGLYAVIAVLGGAALAGVIAPVSGVLRWVAFGVLLVLAGKMAWDALRHRREAATARNADGRMARPLGAYVSLLGLTLLNPATIVYFGSLVLGRRADEGQPAAAAAVWVAAAFVASASWQLFLAGGGTLLGRLLTGARGRLWTALGSSAVIAALAVSLIVSGA
ncbi:LysE family transporter [Dactylosporangium vinaceum]|uniref:LysE family transporter n=1 Tax=Dactylosporangium vinaceum TaxID=53362 RepID=A0ABV5MBF9_9ACTN|nr:LysE family transporter [Dactylosporangium vinaceum]UAB98434.1 LysE family transporter [Dactylosporangium vinaceum]